VYRFRLSFHIWFNAKDNQSPTVSQPATITDVVLYPRSRLQYQRTHSATATAEGPSSGRDQTHAQTNYTYVTSAYTKPDEAGLMPLADLRAEARGSHPIPFSSPPLPVHIPFPSPSLLPPLDSLASPFSLAPPPPFYVPRIPLVQLGGLGNSVL